MCYTVKISCVIKRVVDDDEEDVEDDEEDEEDEKEDHIWAEIMETTYSSYKHIPSWIENELLHNSGMEL